MTLAIFYYLKNEENYRGENTVRLKYDDTHSDQEFSESEVHPNHCVVTPTISLLNTWKTRAVHGNAHAVRGIVYFQRILGQNGCHHTITMGI